MSILKSNKPLSRAEQLRQNRQQPVQRRAAPSVKPAVKSVPRLVPHTTTRPVSLVTRTTTYGIPVRRQVASQSNRKVHYRVGANGVETRLPSLPVINFNWQWLSGFLAVCCLVAVIMMTNMSSFEVNKIETNGFTRVTAGDLMPVLHMNARSVFTLDKAKIMNAIEVTFPELTDIHFRISLPDGVKITARERQPIIAWYNGEEVSWIDAEGVVMPARGEMGELLKIKASSTPPVTNPVVEPASVVDFAKIVIAKSTTETTPEETIHYIDPAVLKAAISMSALMPQGSSLVYDPVSGMGWKDPGGWRVYFGNDLSDMQFKQIEYQAIIDRLNKIGIKPAMVSVEHVDSPYFRTE